MTEFAHCPGDCTSKVKVRTFDIINFCCLNCWNWYFFENMRLPHTPKPLVGRHSEQCDQRQLSRVHEEVVADRTFQIRMGGNSAETMGDSGTPD